MSPLPPSARPLPPLGRGTVVAMMLGLLAACAPTPQAPHTALPPPPPSGAAGPLPQGGAALPQGAAVPRAAPASAGAPSQATIAACRAEAERAAVTQNRGDLMRLDARDRDLAGPNTLFAEQTRGFAQQDRDRLFRECLNRASTGATRIP